MKRLVALVFVTALAGIAPIAALDTTFTASGSPGAPVFQLESDACFICGRTPKDYQSIFDGLIQVLQQNASLPASERTARIAALGQLASAVVSEASMTDDLSLDGLLLIAPPTTDRSSNQKKSAGSADVYSQWMSANRTEIDGIMREYATDAAAATERLQQLLDRTTSITPGIVQAAVRTSILDQLIGSPAGVVRVRLCPVCRALLGK
jgi:hypothetical protein